MAREWDVFADLEMTEVEREESSTAKFGNWNEKSDCRMSCDLGRHSLARPAFVRWQGTVLAS